MTAHDDVAPDPVLTAALERLRLDDADAAEDAAAALDWMVGAAGLAALNQAGLQQFLWYELPFKWLGGPARQRAVADALGRAFDHAGLHRYAAMCRSDTTAEVVTAFAVDPVDGFERFRAAHRRSGVVPPDVELLTWGDLMGPVEFEAFWSSAMTLELAVESGSLAVGGRRAAREGAELVTAHLTRPRPERFGETLLQAIETERITAWFDDPLRRARAQLLEPVVPSLLAAEPVPPSAGRALRPLARLLDLAVAGDAHLTPSGRLTGATAAAVVGRRPGRGEPDAPGAAELRRLAVAARLARVQGRRLVATRRGEAVAGSPAGRWAAAAGHLATGAGTDPEVAELVLALVLDAAPGREVSVDQLVRPVQIATAEGPGGRGGRPRPDDEVRADVLAVLAVVRALGGLRAGSLDDRAPLRLTAAGGPLLRAALRRRATAPRALA
ncbi:MAG: hypothetical protein U0Q07_01595 [Acidimicrobiales bacterium]